MTAAIETTPAPADCARDAGVGAGAALVGERTGLLAGTPAGRAAFTAYLDRLEASGYDRDPAMAKYIARSRDLIAAKSGGSTWP